MKEEPNTVQTIRVIKVSNGFVIVGPKSYIAETEELAKASLNLAFADIVAEFNKPETKSNGEDEKSRIIVPRKTEAVISGK